jgi:hypothetical protein
MQFKTNTAIHRKSDLLLKFKHVVQTSMKYDDQLWKESLFKVSWSSIPPMITKTDNYLSS